MRKSQIADKLAKEARVDRATAADRLDQVVNDILARLRRGEHVSLPGLGTFVPGRLPAFEFEKSPARRGRK